MKRNVSIDILKILSMVMVIVLHYLLYSVKLKELAVGSAQHLWCWFLEAVCVCAVNVYVLITGFFMCDKEFKLARVLKPWIKTLLISIVIYILIACFVPQLFTIKNIVSNIFPIITNRYWFVTCYLVLLLISPYLNMIIKNTNEKKILFLILILLIINVVFDFCGNNLLNSNRGMSVIWFVNLYFMSAYIKKYKNNIGGKVYLFYYLACVIAIFISKNAILYFTSKMFGEARYDTIFYNYNSPLCICASLSLFVFFKNLPIAFKEKTCNKISKIASSTLMVYLFHENVYLRELIFDKMFHSYLEFAALKLVGAIVFIFGVSILLDFCYEHISKSVIKYFKEKKEKKIKCIYSNE